MRRGAFILLEGVDRSGKSSQAKRIVENLINRGIKAKLYNFPNRTTVIGKQINLYLQNKSEVEDHCIHLLFSANRWEARNSIIKDLEDGYTIICDRYFVSGVAFSAAKGLNLDWCLAPDRGLPAPDKILFLDLSPEEQHRRGGFGEERYEVDSFQRIVREKFSLVKNLVGNISWISVDANGTIDEVFNLLKNHVDSTIEDVSDKTISLIYYFC